MSNTMKWIIRIVVGLVVVFAVVAVGYLVFSYIRDPVWEISAHTLRSLPREQAIPRYVIPLRPDRLFPNGVFLRVFPFRNFFAGLFCLGFLILIGIAGVALIYSFTRPRKPEAATSPVIPSTQDAEPAEMAAAIHSCPNCQRVVNEGWNHCPYCGTELTPSE